MTFGDLLMAKTYTPSAEGVNLNEKRGTIKCLMLYQM